jgi:hypothetical protein
MAIEPTVTGVKGWLAVLVVVIGLLVPLGQLGSFLALLKAAPILEPHFASNWTTYFGLASTIMAARAIVCLFVANLLLNRRLVSTPKIAIIGIWTALILLNLISLAVAVAFNPGPVSLSKAVGSLFWLLVFCVIATIYLLRSKRVANTYCIP